MTSSDTSVTVTLSEMEAEALLVLTAEPASIHGPEWVISYARSAAKAIAREMGRR